MSHILEPLIEALAVEAELHPVELHIWTVAALGHRLGLAVAVGEEALPLSTDFDLDGPHYLVKVDLGGSCDRYAEGGDVLDVVDAVESVGRAWLGMIEAMCRQHPDQGHGHWQRRRLTSQT
jgi:hypothetical protein